MNLDLTEGVWRTRVTYSVDCLGGVFPQQLLTAAAELRTVALFQRFKFERDGSNPNLYDYRMWLSDSRMWIQSLLFTAPNDSHPRQTFTVNPGWVDSEFVPHRALRDMMIRCRNELGATVVRIDPV